MATIGPFFTAFSITITSIASPISLWTILSTPAGASTTGYTIAATEPTYVPGAKPISKVTIQNDPINSAGVLVYIGDSQCSSVNHGSTVAPSGSFDFTPVGGLAWSNGVYITASATSTVVNFMVVYG